MFKVLIVVSLLQIIQCHFAALDKKMFSKDFVTNVIDKSQSFDESISRIAKSGDPTVVSSIADIMLKPNAAR
jgi:hypothetical protein